MLNLLYDSELATNPFSISQIEEIKDECNHIQVISEKIVFPLCLNNPMTFVNSIKEDKEIRKLANFSKGTTTLGFIFNEGIILAVDSRASMGSYISSQSVRKIIEINEFLLGTMAGGAADCSFWERHLGRICNLYELHNSERISVAAASNILANIFYQYRGYGLCSGIMIAGCDYKGPQLYYVDDSGKRLCGKLFSIGSGSTYAYGILDSYYKQDMTLEEAVDLAKRAIYHATYRDAGSGGVVRVYHLHKDGWNKLEDGQNVFELHEKYMEEKLQE